MIERLIFNENAYFYNQYQNLSRRRIEQIFREVSRDKRGNFNLKLIKQQTRVNNKNLFYSVCVFKYTQSPSFLENGLEEEVKYAYLMIIECDNYLVINKKNISGLDKLLRTYINGLDYDLISRLFLSDRTFFEKFSMSNMDISDNVIRRRNIEAINLKDSYAPFGASKYILNNMRISDSGNKFSLTFNTSRINKLGRKVELEDFLAWVIEVINKIQTFVAQECYLDHFARPLNFQEHIENLRPKSLLFIFNDLISDIEKGLLRNAYYLLGEKRRNINLVKYLDAVNKLCEIESEHNDDSINYRLNNRLDKSLSLRINKNSILIASRKLKKINLDYGDEKELSLQTYINRNQNFIICFEEIEVVYWSRKLFKDSALLGNIEYFMSIFTPFHQLEAITSEKGNPTRASSRFDNDCLFDFTENVLAADCDFIFCDDLGNEWADHITIKESSKIVFFHAKHGNEGLSASDFQIVVAQAQKNLGNIFASENELNRKKLSWVQKYGETNIERLRKGANVDEGVELYRKTLLSPNARKVVYLVVNFISKSRLGRELNNLRQGQPAPYQVVQILWLLSSLILSCKESNTDVYIACLP